MKKLITFFAFILLLNLTTLVNAQPLPGGGGGGGGGTPGNPPCWPNPAACIPIDGGIGFLIAAAAAFGAKKLYNKNIK
jgi:hypothetical protein